MTAPLETSVIAIGNQKGGVGKSTASITVAAALGEMGKKVLIVDLDSSAGATKAFGVPTEGWIDTYDMISGAEDPEGCIITDTDEEIKNLPKNVHLIPASRRVEELENFLLRNKFVAPQDLLINPIRQLRGKYDYIILDTPPNVKKTWPPALKAADYLVLIAIPEDLAIQGLGDALKDFKSAREMANPELELLGVIVSHVPKPKTRLARLLIKTVTDLFTIDGKSLKFDTEISRTVAVGEAMAIHQTIFQYDGTHKVAEQYRKLAREIDGRVNAKPVALPEPEHVNVRMKEVANA